MFKAKKPSYSEDMFADTRMTFGEHIEDLRIHLWRAINGFVVIMSLVFVLDGIGFATDTSFGIGRPVLDFIIAPVGEQLEEYDHRQAKKIVRELENSKKLKEANRSQLARMSFFRAELEAIVRGGPSNNVLEPLPEDGKPIPFADLVGRAQVQRAAALYVMTADNWEKLKVISKELQQTARRFSTAIKAPPDLENQLEDWVEQLNQETDQLVLQAERENASDAEKTLQAIKDLLGDREMYAVWVQIDDPVRLAASLSPAEGQVHRRYTLSTLSIMEAFMAYLKVALVCGLVLGSPWIFYQIWAFIAAGLYPHEKRLVNVYLPFSLGLFLIGAFACQFIVIPKAVGALLWFNERLHLEPELRFNEWLSFAILMPLVFGISFQLPLVMMFLERLGIMTVQMYYSYWKIAFFLIHVVAAILMPTPDIISMECLALPMFGLYGLGILLCRLNPGKSEQDLDVPQSEEMVEV